MTDPDPEDDDGRQIWWPGYVINTEGEPVRKKFQVIIIVEGEGPTPEEIMTAIAEGVNDQNPGVTMIIDEIEGE